MEQSDILFANDNTNVELLELREDGEGYSQEQIQINHLKSDEENTDNDDCKENSVTENENLFLRIQNSKYPIVLVEKLSSCSEKKYVCESSENASFQDSQVTHWSKDLNQFRRTEDSGDISKDSLFQLEIKANGNLFKCTHCTYETKYKRIAVRHSKIHSQKVFKCSSCDYETNQKILFKNHQNTHESKLFLCSHCNFKTEDEGSLERHQELKHINSNYKCSHSQCDFETKRKPRLKAHLLTHKFKFSSEKEENNSGQPSLQEFQCSKCIYNTKSILRFESHILKHDRKLSQRKEYKNLKAFTDEIITEDENMFRCKLCNYFTKNKHHSKRHAQTHSAIKVFKCTECDYGTNRKDKFLLHMLNHSDIKPFKCSNCNYKTNEQSKLKAHLLIHLKTIFKCSECDYETNRQNSYKNHLLSHEKKEKLNPVQLPEEPFYVTEVSTQSGITNMFNCSLCNYKTINRSLAEKHSFTHSNKTFKCIKCSFETSHKDKYKLHVFKNHKGVSKKASKVTSKAVNGTVKTANSFIRSVIKVSKNIFYCSICNFKAQKYYDAKRHALTHSDVRLFKCSECQFRTNRKNRYTTHLINCRVDKRFNCLLCNFTTVNENELNNHMLEHNTNELKSFQCSECSYECNTKIHLKEHMLSIHKLTLSQCSEYDFESNETSFKEHLACGIGGKLMKCPQSNLNDHLVTHSQPALVNTFDNVESVELNYSKNANHQKVEEIFFNCFKCDFASSKGNILQLHMEVCHSIKKRRKSKWDNDTSRKDQLNHPGVAYQCSECQFQTHDKWKYNRHLTSNRHVVNVVTGLETYSSSHGSINLDKTDFEHQKDKKTREDASTENEDSGINCNEAEEVKSNTQKRKDNQLNSNVSSTGNVEQISLENKLYRCFKCSFMTYDGSSFEKHLSTSHHLRSQHLLNAEAKIYKCTDCDYNTNLKSRLNKHLLTHSAQRKYQCLECPYKTSVMLNYQRHGRNTGHSMSIKEISSNNETESTRNVDLNICITNSHVTGIDNDNTEMVNGHVDTHFSNGYDLSSESINVHSTSSKDSENLDTREGYISQPNSDANDCEKSDLKEESVSQPNANVNDFEENKDDFIILKSIDNFELNKVIEDSEKECIDDSDLSKYFEDFEFNQEIYDSTSEWNDFKFINGDGNVDSELNTNVDSEENKTNDVFELYNDQDDFEQNLENDFVVNNGNISSKLSNEKIDSVPTKCISKKRKRSKFDQISADTLEQSSQITADQIFNCYKCDFVTSIGYDFEKHMAVCHKVKLNAKSYKCSECFYITDRKDRFTSHMLNHSGIKLYQCPECPYGTNDKWNYNRHQVTWSHGPCIQSDLGASERFSCPHCDYKTNHTGTFKRHLLSHSKAKPFKCCVCGFETNRKYLLKTHLASHSKESNFGHVQNKKIKVKEEIIEPEVIEQLDSSEHENVEETEYMPSKNNESILEFSCSKCNYKTNHTGTFKRHLLTHNGLKRFKCSICDFETNRKYLMNTHISIHSQKSNVCVDNVKLESVVDVPEVTETIGEINNVKIEEQSEYTASNDEEQVQEISCQKCAYKSKNNDDFKMHLNSHQELQKLKCSECDFETWRKHALRKHMLTHRNGSYHVGIGTTEPYYEVATIEDLELNNDVFDYHNVEIKIEPENTEQIHELSFNEF